MRAVILVLACLALLLTTRSARGAARRYGDGLLVDGQGNTLAGIARDLAHPGLFSFDRGRALCAGPLTLTGELIIHPGESLVFQNPQREWARRLVYLLGRMDFRDCELAGAYWIVVGPQASGAWRDVRILSGPNAGSGYPLLYFNSSQLEWDGGLLDAHPQPDLFTPVALSSRQGYYPGSVTNTIRNVTIRSRDYAVFDPPSLGVEVDLTFQGCLFETSGEDHARIASWANASDLGRTRVVLQDCRRVRDGRPAPFDEIGVHGSAAEIVEITGDDERLHRAEDLTSLDDDPPAGIWHRLRALSRLRRRADELARDPRLRGSLYMPRFWLDRLRRIRTAIGLNRRYGPGDAGTVTRLMDLLEDTLETAPLTLQVGGPYHPRPAPLDWAPPGRAHIEILPDGRVRVESYRSVLFYSPGGPGVFARLTEESAIRGRPVFDAVANLGGPSLRHLSPSDSALMLWEQPWAVEIVQNDAPIVGFTATVQNAHAHGAAVTHVFFHDLPDVILYDVASLQRDDPPQPVSVRFAAYANPAHRSYNGMRFWSDDPQGVEARLTRDQEAIAPGEPEHGLFVAREGNFWMHPHLVRGALVAQWNGGNDWRRYPPAGYIIRKDECDAIYVNSTGYYAHVVQLSKPGRTRCQLLWFEGGGLRCWENIFNLDQAFNHPCQIALRLDETGLEVEAVETAGLRRNAEIVILPQVFNALETDLPLFRGESTIALLRDVDPGSRRRLGRLPVALSPRAPGRFEIRSDLGAPLPQVEIRLRGVEKAARVRHGDHMVETFEAGAGALSYRAPIAPGLTRIVVE